MEYSIKRGSAFVQGVRGEVELGEKPLSAGDGAAISHEKQISVKASTDAEVLLFDLPSGS